MANKESMSRRTFLRLITGVGVGLVIGAVPNTVGINEESISPNIPSALLPQNPELPAFEENVSEQLGPFAQMTLELFETASEGLAFQKYNPPIMADKMDFDLEALNMIDRMYEAERTKPEVAFVGTLGSAGGKKNELLVVSLALSALGNRCLDEEVPIDNEQLMASKIFLVREADKKGVNKHSIVVAPAPGMGLRHYIKIEGRQIQTALIQAGIDTYLREEQKNTPEPDRNEELPYIQDSPNLKLPEGAGLSDDRFANQFRYIAGTNEYYSLFEIRNSDFQIPTNPVPELPRPDPSPLPKSHYWDA